MERPKNAPAAPHGDYSYRRKSHSDIPRLFHRNTRLYRLHPIEHFGAERAGNTDAFVLTYLLTYLPNSYWLWLSLVSATRTRPCLTVQHSHCRSITLPVALVGPVGGFSFYGRIWSVRVTRKLTRHTPISHIVSSCSGTLSFSGERFSVECPYRCGHSLVLALLGGRAAARTCCFWQLVLAPSAGRSP